ncbi:hypothetical protein [Anaeroselena agilis]|uniref:Uncharacterized protein n=1 Tax=Anaeroselena agilis TaxID=3063788 RepID=A0ABU3NZX9_9FIRM|nr:hypothetical protein [Selenomonadales bacterium 4137-cl]
MRAKTLIILITVAALTALLPAVSAAADDKQPLFRFKGKVRWVESLGTYGLLSDEGKQYHPIRKLPRAYQKNDLAVVVEGRLRPDLVGSRMYGAAFEVKQITRAEKYVSPEEWEAVRLLLLRMEAFNEKDIVKLRSVDKMALRLSREQFDAWLAGWGSYTLHYVEAVNSSGPRPGDKTIEGICLYSRQRVNSMAVSGNMQYALMKFTLAKEGGSWQFIATDTYQPGTDKDEAVAAYLTRAVERFGTTDLAKAKK